MYTRVAVACLAITLLSSAAIASPICETAADCTCGSANIDDTCAVGPPSAVSANLGECDAFCNYFSLVTVCRAGQCARARQSPCPVDCDADLETTIDELTLGAAIVLGKTARACPVARNQPLDVTALVRGVGAALDGCVAGLGDGNVYDATFGDNTTGVATSSRYPSEPTIDDYWIHLGPNQSVSLGVDPTTDVLVRPTLWQTDFGVELSGTVSVQRTEAEERLTALVMQNVEGPFQYLSPTTIVLYRPLTPTARPYGGTYRFTWSTDPARRSSEPEPVFGSIRFFLNDHGVGLMTGGIIETAAGEARGTITSGQCDVGVEGNLYCTAAYLVAGSTTTDQFRLTGRFALSGQEVTASGTFLAGVDPPQALHTNGEWTAVRISNEPGL